MGSKFQLKAHRSVKEVEGQPVQNDGTVVINDDKAALRVIKDNADDFVLVDTDSEAVAAAAHPPTKKHADEAKAGDKH